VKRFEVCQGTIYSLLQVSERLVRILRLGQPSTAHTCRRALRGIAGCQYLLGQREHVGIEPRKYQDCRLDFAVFGRFLDERRYFDDGNITFAPTVRYLSTEHQVDRTPMAGYAIFATF